MNLYTEETDKALPDYPLPEQIEKFIEGGKYRNVEARVTRVNYQRRMHNLLYLEEYKQREDMSRCVCVCTCACVHVCVCTRACVCVGVMP